MPFPTTSDLHVNAPLTNVSIAWLQSSDKFIADKVFPKVPVQKRSDLYWKWSKSDWRRTDVQKRAPGTESKGVGWQYTTDNYYCDVFAVHKDIDDQVRSNADSNFKLDSDASKFVTNQLLLKRDIDFCGKYLAQGVWSTEYVGKTASPGTNQFLAWDQSGSDPLSDFSGWKINFEQLTGESPSFIVIGAYVMKTLSNHPAILDRIKYTQRGVITADLIASLFGVPKLFVPKATQATGPQINDAVAQDSAASYSFIAPSKSIMFGFAPDAPSLQTPSAGYTFTWNGYLGGNSEGLRIKRFRMEHLESDRVEGSMTYDMKVVAPDMGVYVSSVVS